MLSKAFEKPIRIWVGLGFPCELRTVEDAYLFAQNWRGNGPERRAAIRACKAAMAGEVDPETARGVFDAFARKKDVLLADETMQPGLIKSGAQHV